MYSFMTKSAEARCASSCRRISGGTMYRLIAIGAAA